MTVRLSPHKVSKIMRHYFGGMPQTDIAKKAGVDQSTVSIYASRFKDRVSEAGLLAAGKEFGVFNEVDALRSLSVELSKADLTPEEARQGLEIMKAFVKLGISPDQHAALVKVCAKIGDPGFVHAAVKLANIEAKASMPYEEVTARFEKASSELPSVEKKLQEMQTQLESTAKSLAQRKHELASVEAHLAQLQDEAKTKQAGLEQELATKMKELKVKLAELEEMSKLKAELAESGLDIPTLVKLAKEFCDGNTKG